MTPRQVAIVVYGLSDNWLGGVNYYRNLVSVFDDAGADDMRLHVLTDDTAYFDDLGLSARVQLHRLPMLVNRSAPWVARKLLSTLMRRDVLLVRRLRQLRLDAAVFCHVPGLAAAGVRCLPWIPDFQSRHHPELFQPAVVAAEHQRAQQWLRDSDGLIVSSQTARQDAVALYGAEASRLHVLSFAPRLAATPLLDHARRDAAWARHGLSRPYFFLPNQYWTHKNHAVVLRALQLMRERGDTLPLVVSTGKTQDLRDPGHFERFSKELHAQGLQDSYRILGVIDREDMLLLLAHSVAVINPSRFEGWSTSVEEAKALGKRLLVSDIAVHREQVAGLADAGIFDPDDAATLASLMSRMRPPVDDIASYPPRPRPEIYENFREQYVGLLRRLLDAPARV